MWQTQLYSERNHMIHTQHRKEASECMKHHTLASFPGLHAQLLSLAVRKAGEGLDGFIT